MSLNWENKWDPYYSRFRRALTRPSSVMALNNDLTTAQSLISILQRTDSHYSTVYDDRRRIFDTILFDCDEVYPHVFIGDGATAKMKDILKTLGITHILNTAEGKGLGMVDTNRYFYEDVGMKYLGFQLLDHRSTNIARYFNQAADFIHNALACGGRVYVHCLMGMSRSSTCVIAYLMLKRGMSAAEAIRTVKQRRDIHPNEGFLQQLADLDNSLRRGKRSLY